MYIKVFDDRHFKVAIYYSEMSNTSGSDSSDNRKKLAVHQLQATRGAELIN